jgi:sugar-specific transcriptional regulator TrmB
LNKNAIVARPDIYRTLSKLQQLGLVERIIKTPVEYKAISADKGLKLLLETKTMQYKKVEAETEILLDKIMIKKPNNTNQIANHQFVLISKRTVVDRIGIAIEKAQLNMDLVLSWRIFSRGITSTFTESFENAWARNVKVRVITESVLESKTVKQLIQLFREKPFCQIRFTRHYP